LVARDDAQLMNTRSGDATLEKNVTELRTAEISNKSLGEGYSLEERESQISLLRQLKKKRRDQTKLKPPSLVQALREQNTVSVEDIKALVEKEYKSPVISLYINLSGDRAAPKGKAVARVFDSMKHRMLDERKSFIEAIDRHQQEMLTYDLKEIEDFLADYLAQQDVRALIIFKSGEELNRVIPLGVPTTDLLTINPDPSIAPLEVLFEEHERVLFFEVTKEKSRFAVYQLGVCVETGRMGSFVPTDRVDDSIPGRVQRHRLTHLKWHLKATAQHVDHIYREWSCQSLVAMGEERVLHLLEEFLHPSLRERIISRVYGSPVADSRDRKHLIADALRDHKAALEVNEMEELSRYKPADQIVFGLPDAVEVCNLFLVRKLVVAERLNKAGFVCKNHHYVSLEGGSCPFCNTKLLPVDNVVDEIIEIARLHGVSVTMVNYRQDLMTKYADIAAVIWESPNLN
jgi:hypothetical protein